MTVDVPAVEAALRPWLRKHHMAGVSYAGTTLTDLVVDMLQEFADSADEYIHKTLALAEGTAEQAQTIYDEGYADGYDAGYSRGIMNNMQSIVDEALEAERNEIG